MNTEALKTILIVEDERVVAMDIQRSLQKIGYEVPATAISGEEALRMASERRPDLSLALREEPNATSSG